MQKTLQILGATALVAACGGTESVPAAAPDGAAGGSAGADAGVADAAGDSEPPKPDPCLAPAPEPSPSTFWVSISGSDQSDGSATAPWATLTHAVDNVPDGATVVVRPGRYEQVVHLDRRFEQGIVLRAEVPYRSRLRYAGTVVRAFYGAGITLEGFDIAHTGLDVEPVVVHVQDLVEGPEYVERIVLRNNVIHDSRAADLIKINNGARFVTVERNVVYNQAGTAEHVNVDSATDVVIQDNVFFNDFAGSGAYNDNDTGSFVAVKAGSSSEVTTAYRVVIRRNVFANWEGSPGSHFILLGGWGLPNVEVEDATIENNLLIGNSKNPIRSAFGIKSAVDTVFRNNTVVGDLPAAAYALRMVREGESPPNDNVRFYNNIWSDPTGTMHDFSDAPPADTTSFLLDNNVYYNGGTHLPGDDSELVNIWDDARRITDDPKLPEAASVSLPRWDAETETFTDGAASVCEAFDRLVLAHCLPGPESAALGAALVEHSPEDDLSGRARSATPDIGACQRP